MRIPDRRAATLTALGTLAAIALIGTVDRLAAQTPCQDDIAKFCSKVSPGAGRVFACLQANEAELSPACRKTLETRRTTRSRRPRQRSEAERAWVSACAADIKELCRDVPSGRGQVVGCLEQHEAALSEACRAALAARSAPPSSAAR